MHPRHDEDEADRLLAATVYLMSCHARTGCPRIACMVRHHLQLIGRHGAVPECLRDMAQKMASAWNAIAAHDERRVHAQPDAPRSVH